MTLSLISSTILLATTYGFGEYMCGDNVSSPKPCNYGQLTASGVPFDALSPTVAVYSSPDRIIRKNTLICIKHLQNKTKVWLPVTDKHYKKGRIDLSPSAVARIGGKVSSYWSSQVHLCGEVLSPWYQMKEFQSLWLNGKLTPS